MFGRSYHRQHVHLGFDGIGIICTTIVVLFVLLVVPATRGWTLDAIQNVCTAIVDAFVAVFTSMTSR